MKTSVCLAAGVVTLVVIQMVNAQETTQPPRKFICPRCDFVCVPGSIESKMASIIGCPPCRCPHTCRNIKCPYGEKCVMEQVSCKTTPCHPQPTCVSVNDFTTTDMPATVAAPNCKEVMCMVGCERVMGPDGCPICDCQKNCTNFKCSYGEKCVMEQVPCKTTPCHPQPTCVSVNDFTTTDMPATVAAPNCKEVMCMVGCERVMGPDGCPICDCQKNCTNFKCSYGEKCVMEQVFCKTTPCHPQPTCVSVNDMTTTKMPATTATKFCAEVMCRVGCERLLGSDGCPFCHCQTNCTAVACPIGFECQMSDVPCVATACTGPRAICVPIQTTAAPTPCPVYKCAEGCVPSTGTDGCPTCICNRTCKDVNCTKDEECVLTRQLFCPKWDPCFLIPTCVPRSETTTPTILESSTKKCEQNIACRDECRLLMDSDGCQYCDCPLTCETVECPYGSTCEMSSVSCSSPSICFKSPLCVPIIETTTPTIPESSTKKCERNINCSEECRLLMDSDGCPYCDCPLTCETVECRYGNTCEMRPVSCPRPSFCERRPLCVPIIEMTTMSSCPMVSCDTNCVVVTGSNGCPTCKCNQTCRDVNCTEGEECDMKQNDCQTPPCPHTPTCFISSSVCRMKPPCYLPCSSKFKRDKEGCIICECEE